MNEIVLNEKKWNCLDETQQIVNFGTNWRVCNQMWLTNEFLPKWNFRSEKKKWKEKKMWKERKIDRGWTKIQTNSFYIDKEKKEIKLSSGLKQTRNCNQILRNKAVPT